MNVSRFDIGMLFALTVFVVLMSLTAPVFGLTTENSTNASDIPEYNVSTDRFDNLGEFPVRPSNPSSGTLNKTEGEWPGQTVNRDFVLGSYQNVDGIEVSLGNNVNDNSTASIYVFEWTSGTLKWQKQINLTEGEEYTYENQSQGIVLHFEMKRVTANHTGNNNYSSEATFAVKETPQDKGLFNNLPIVGGLISSADALGGFVGWIGSILFYFVLLAAEIALNVINTLIGTTVYVISLMHWLFSTYFGIINGAPGWVGVFMAAPGVLLFGMLSKFMFVGIKMLPFT